MNRTIAPILFLVATICAQSRSSANDGALKRSALTQLERIDTDARAVQVQPESQDRQQAIAGVSSWLVAHTPLPKNAEDKRAAQLHERIERKAAAIATPQLASRILDRLVKEIPTGISRGRSGYEIRLIDRDDTNGFTVGGGVIFITKPFWESITRDVTGRDDRVAFVIAQQLGHECRGHSRFQFQFDDLKADLEARTDKAKTRLGSALLKGTVDLAAAGVSSANSTRQVLQADMFAIHLCRNAGFNLESALDVLRLESQREIRQEHDAVTEIVDPTGLTAEKVKLPSAMFRLGRLRDELDGQLPRNSNDYGLREFRDGAFEPFAKDARIKADEKVVVFVHGMESGLPVYRSFASKLAKHAEDETGPARILGFQYPNDMSLAGAGIALHRQIKNAVDPGARLIFVCHSAGGLVFRYYSQVLQGEFEQAIFQGTPHHGSDLTTLRDLIELRQLLGGFLKFQYSAEFERVVRDGQSQIGFDLTPNSLFLRYVERFACRANQFCCQRGQAMSRTNSVLLTTAVASARRALRRKLDDQADEEMQDVVDGLLLKLVERIRLPSEVTQGDLAVTLESASVNNAARVETYRCTHFRLPKKMDVTNDAIGFIRTQFKTRPAQ